MNKYQIAIPPNGDVMQVAADRMENIDGDLKFFQGNTVVGEARYWQAWALIDELKVTVADTEQATIDRLVKQ